MREVLLVVDLHLVRVVGTWTTGNEKLNQKLNLHTRVYVLL